MKQMQRGITMIGFLITLTFVIFFAYCGMKIGPMYMEFFSVKKALAGIASDPEAANASKEKIRTLLNKRFQIDYVSVVKPEMLKLVAQHVVAKGLERVPTLPNDLSLKFRLVSAAPPEADDEGGDAPDEQLLQRLHRALDRLGGEPRKVVLHLPTRQQAPA